MREGELIADKYRVERAIGANVYRARDVRLDRAVAIRIGDGDKALRLEVTVSIGLAAHAPGRDSDKLVERADAAMYAAKQAGRNVVR